MVNSTRDGEVGASHGEAGWALMVRWQEQSSKIGARPGRNQGRMGAVDERLCGWSCGCMELMGDDPSQTGLLARLDSREKERERERERDGMWSVTR